MKEARAVLAAKSKSFALAGRLLGEEERDRAAIVYAWCRRADDAIDEGAAGPAALARLEGELDAVYRDAPTGDATLDAFGEVVRACRIPRAYPDELLAGMAMDTGGTTYHTRDDLLLYAFRVAGTVGLMMCHVLGLRDDRALLRGVHLGIAMQLTNICRDVHEDWQRARLYLPRDLLAAAGAPALTPGGPFPAAARAPVAAATRQLLALADTYYRSADRGIPDLPWRAGLAIRAARLIYAAIGDHVAAQQHDPLAPRAVVPTRQKLLLALRAASFTRPSFVPARIPTQTLGPTPDVLRI